MQNSCFIIKKPFTKERNIILPSQLYCLLTRFSVLLLLNKQALPKLVSYHHVTPWSNMAQVSKQSWVFDRLHPLHVKGILWKGEKEEDQTQTPFSEGLVHPVHTQLLSYREKMNERKGNLACLKTLKDQDLLSTLVRVSKTQPEWHIILKEVWAAFKVDVA